MTSAHGLLTLRPAADGLAGTLTLHGYRIELEGEIRDDTLTLHGNLTDGELRRDGDRRIGTLRHGGYPYVLDGGWQEDAEGWSLRCVVGEK